MAKIFLKGVNLILPKKVFLKKGENIKIIEIIKLVKKEGEKYAGPKIPFHNCFYTFLA